jgi:surface carbohydrate biosynthesis protein
MTKVLLFPVETIARELDYRILLAAGLTKAGFRIFVGKHTALMAGLPAFQGACYLGKEVIRPYDPRNTHDLERLRQYSLRFIHFDTEGAVYLGQESDWRREMDSRLEPSVLGAEDAVFTWGQFQRDHYASRGKVPVFVVGNPHFDLPKPKYRDYFRKDCSEIRAKYGNFVLINTNFAWANHGNGFRQVFSLPQGYNLNDTSSIDRTIQGWLDNTRHLTNFVELVHSILKYTNKRVVIRPHPSESLDLYTTIFHGRDRVFVVRDGPAAPWLIAAEKVVHHGSTTAVEAWFADTPAIHFEDSQNPTEFLQLPRSVSHVAGNLEECMSLLTSEDSRCRPQAKDLRTDLLLNFEEESLERFKAALTELELNDTEVSASQLNKLMISYKAKEKMLWPLRRVRHSVSYAYGMSKFPGFSNDLVQRRITASNFCVGSQAKCKIHNPQLIEIYADP